MNSFTIFMLLSYLGFTAFDVSMMIYRSKSTNKQILKKYEEEGYIVNPNIKNNFYKKIGSMSISEFIEIEQLHYALSILPVTNIYLFFPNILRIFGIHTSVDDDYDRCINKCLDKLVVNKLKLEELIKNPNEPILTEKEKQNLVIEINQTKRNRKKELEQLRELKEKLYSRDNEINPFQKVR